MVLTRTPRAVPAPPLVALAAFLVVLTSCSGADPEPPADVAHWTNSSDPDLVGAPGAALVGTLQLLDGCVVVVDDAGTETVPLFPTPVAWDDDVLVTDGVRLTLGEEVLLGGAQRDQGLRSDVIPQACGRDRAQFRVHQS